MWGDMLCWILACIGVVIIMCLGGLLFLIGVTIVLHIIEWALPRWDSLFEDGEAAGKE